MLPAGVVISMSVAGSDGADRYIAVVCIDVDESVGCRDGSTGDVTNVCIYRDVLFGCHQVDIDAVSGSHQADIRRRAVGLNVNSHNVPSGHDVDRSVDGIEILQCDRAEATNGDIPSGRG